jgi:hypothetical protein
MKSTRDFDLSFRPNTYWEHGDPIAAILAGIKGEARRELVIAALEAGEEISEGLLDSLLEESLRQGWGALHPLLMGGEYLPSDLPGETTIARISLRSTTGDVSEVRARPTGRGIRYRIVDEYETEFVLPFDRSETPLSLGELIKLIDESDGFEEEPGLVRPVIHRNFGLGDPPTSDPEWVKSVRQFVIVSSQFYPELRDYYVAFVEEWMIEVSR